MDPWVQSLVDALAKMRMEPWRAILIGATGTWIIALFAIGDRLIGPKLRVRHTGFSGDMALNDIGPGTKPRSRLALLRQLWGHSAARAPSGRSLNARYYFVRASNSRRRFRTAHEVQLIITRIEKEVGNVRQIIWDEIMPVSWVRQELYTILTRTVGPDASAAVFYVQADGVLGITPAHGPKGEVPRHFPVRHQGSVTLWVRLQAISIEADSSPVTLKITWDGKWHHTKAALERACCVQFWS